MSKKQIDITQAHRLLNAGAIVLVTVQAKGTFNIHASPWAMPVSLRPPLVAVAIPPHRLTFDLIKRSGEFVLNVPSLELAKQVKQIGSVSGYDVDKLKATGLHLAEPKLVGVSLLSECIGHLECALQDVFELGDHAVFVGEVVAAWAETEAFDLTWVLREKDLRPLHHLGGEQYAVLELASQDTKQAEED